MGGMESGVTEKTKRVVLESALFNPAIIRAMSQRHKIHSEASHEANHVVMAIRPRKCPNLTVQLDRNAADLARAVPSAFIAHHIHPVLPPPEQYSTRGGRLPPMLALAARGSSWNVTPRKTSSAFASTRAAIELCISPNLLRFTMPTQSMPHSFRYTLTLL